MRRGEQEALGYRTRAAARRHDGRGDGESSSGKECAEVLPQHQLPEDPKKARREPEVVWSLMILVRPEVVRGSCSRSSRSNMPLRGGATSCIGTV